MGIGLVVPGGVDPSGVRRVVPHLVERIGGLSGGGHHVRVVALRQQPRPASWELAGARVINPGRPARRLRAFRALVREHRRQPFDVLHAFALVPQAPVALAAGRLLGTPVVAEAPGGEFASLPEIDFGGWRRAPGRFWIRLAARNAALLTVPSEAARRLAGSRGVRARLVPLELSADAWPSRPPRRRSGGESFRLLWVGSLNRVKDPALMVRAVAGLAGRGVDVRADVVGEDLSGGRIAAAVAAAGLTGRVTLHGWLPQAQLRKRMDRAHVLLVTSRFESGPRVVLEAAARGVPAVGPPVGILEAWAPRAALSVETRSAPAFAAALESLARDEELRLSLAGAAAARIAAHRLPSVLAEWEGLYREVAGEPREHAHA